MSRNKNKVYTTIKLSGIAFECESDRQLVYDYCRQQTHIVRSVFKRSQEGVECNFSSFDDYNDINLLDSWWKQSAVYEGKAASSSFDELKKQTDKKIHLCFGGKNNQRDYQNNKITKEEYEQNRIHPLTSIGEKNSGTKRTGGNRKFKLSDDLTYATLKLKEKKIKILLPKKIHKKYKKLLYDLITHRAIGDIPITYKVDMNALYISVDVKDLYTVLNYDSISNRIMAIDMNPNYIGWVVVEWISENEYKIIASGVFSIKKLNDREYELMKKHLPNTHPERKHITNKREYDVYEIAHMLMRICAHYKCSAFVIEKLDIKAEDCGRGKRYNKLVNNQWLRTAFVDSLKKLDKITNIRLLEIIPEYSSFVGNFLFRDENLPDMCLAALELSRRGYEFFHQHVVKDKDKKKNIVFPDVKMFARHFVGAKEVFGIS